MRWPLILAAVLGAGSVIAGAALRHMYGNIDGGAINTALHYHQINSIVLLALGLYLLERESAWQTILPPALIGVGTFIFSGSLYAMVLLGIPALGMLTPVGGLCLITGWLSCGLLVRR